MYLGEADLFEDYDDLIDDPLFTPEMLDILTTDEIAYALENRAVQQLGGLGDLDGFFKSITRRIKRTVKKVAALPKKAIKKVKQAVKKVGKLAKKVVRAHLDVLSLGYTYYQRKVKKIQAEIAAVERQLAATKDPKQRAALMARLQGLRDRLNRYKSKRMRGLKVAAVAAGGWAAYNIAGPHVAGMLKAGKALAMQKLLPALLGQGMPQEEAEEVVETMVDYPPDPQLTDPQAMVADSMTKKAVAEESKKEGGETMKKSLPWIAAAGAAGAAFIL